ncbi:hypothetical protein ACFWHQ_27720 [Streptomyces sp. NPDC060334]|uniref:hypothetical protein n=1 Tax=Streptomyces sp. NPDC060334 TaxID=3347099 RepID=UPI00366868B0
MSQYQTAGTNAQLKMFALLAAQGVPAAEADELVAALEAGAQSEVVELDGMAPRSRGPVFEDGWDAGVRPSARPWWASLTGTGPGAAAGRPGPLNWPYTWRT